MYILKIFIFILKLYSEWIIDIICYLVGILIRDVFWERKRILFVLRWVRKRKIMKENGKWFVSNLDENILKKIKFRRKGLVLTSERNIVNY